MSVTVTLRSEKGSPLTIPEVDTNFSNIKTAVDAQDSLIAAAAATANDAASDVASLSGTVSSLSSEVSDHESRITVIEGGGGGGAGSSFFSATKSASQVVSTSGTPAKIKISYGVENADASGAYNPTLSQFTAPSTGWYWLSASCRIDGIAMSTPQDISNAIWCLVNGGGDSVVCETHDRSGGTAGQTISTAGAVYLTLGDYVEVYFVCDVGGGSVTWQLTNDGAKSWFQGFKVSS